MNDKNNELDEEATFAKEALQCEIGVKLQHAREEKGYDSDFIIKELKFNKIFLDALESGNWDKMPGEVYALGFLRQYANLLGVDVNADVERMKSNIYELTTPVTYPDALISPNRIWAITAIIIFIIIIIVINFSDSDNEASNPSQSITEESLSLSAQPQQDKTPISLQTNPSLNIVDKKITTSDTSTKEQPLLITTKPESIPSTAITHDKKTYSFYAATNDVWLQVFEAIPNAEPKLLREVLLKKGQSFSIVNTSAKLLLTAGNSRALEILENDKVLFAANTLGKEGKVLKRYLINP